MGRNVSAASRVTVQGIVTASPEREAAEREILRHIVRASDLVPGQKSPAEWRMRSGIARPFRDELVAIDAIAARALEWPCDESALAIDRLHDVAVIVVRYIGGKVERVRAAHRAD